jgi:hypothetical protein
VNPYAPPAPQGSPYPPPAPVPPGGRPTTGVKVLAWFQIVLGALSIVGIPCALGMRGFATSFGPHDEFNEKIQNMPYEGGLGIWTYSQLAVGGVLAIVLLASGIGLLGAKPWARTSSLIYAVVTLVLQVIGQVVTFVFLYPAITAAAEERGGAAGNAAVTGAYIGGICGGLFAFALPITMLIVLTRPSVKAQFV